MHLCRIQGFQQGYKVSTRLKVNITSKTPNLHFLLCEHICTNMFPLNVKHLHLLILAFNPYKVVQPLTGLELQEKYKNTILKSSLKFHSERNETDSKSILITSRNDDRKIMQPIRITNRSLMSMTPLDTRLQSIN